MEPKPVQPAFRILGCHQYGTPCELLVVRGVAVGLETGLNVRTLVFGKPADCFGVVADEPVGYDCDNDGEETFL